MQKSPAATINFAGGLEFGLIGQKIKVVQVNAP